MPNWTQIGGEDLVEDDDVVQVVLDKWRLAVYKVEGRVYVTDDRCTHQEASLSDGYLEGTTIECPRHQGVFDICSGKPLCPPVVDMLRTYDVRVTDGRIEVDLSED